MKRSESIDILRGCAVILMVFSGVLPFAGALPAWMYHAQVPPPLHKFDPSVAGITWVDLVFPFFLFAMGAAVPLAFDTKSLTINTLKKIFQRFTTMLIFCILVWQLNPLRLPTMGWWANILGVLMYGFFFLAFGKISFLPKKQDSFVKIIGWIGFGAMCAWAIISKKTIDPSVNDAIIRVLANVYALGVIIWLLTRSEPMLRMGVFTIAACLYLGSTASGTWVSWFWNLHDPYNLLMPMLQKYLLIFLPGTLVGDFILQKKQDLLVKKEIEKETSASKSMAYVLLLGTTLSCLIGLLSREVALSFWINAAFLAVGFYTLKSNFDKKMLALASIMLVAGYLAEPFQGGIKKDHATLSYFFITSGLATLWILAFEKNSDSKNAQNRWFFDPLSHVGKNALMAYAMASFLIVPVMKLTRFDTLFPLISSKIAVFGTIKGCFITLAVILLTSFFTKRQIFWKI